MLRFVFHTILFIDLPVWRAAFCSLRRSFHCLGCCYPGSLSFHSVSPVMLGWSQWVDSSPDTYIMHQL